MSRWLPRLRRLLYGALPVFILALIFQRIDLDRLGGLALQLSPAPVVWGVLASGVIVMLGALRWHLLRGPAAAAEGYASSLGGYWRALAAGLLLPGSLGMDAYRVLEAAGRPGGTLGAAQGVVAEKLAALAACALVVGATLPVLAPQRLPVGAGLIGGALAGLAACALGLLAVLRSRRCHAAWTRAALALAARAGRSAGALPTGPVGVAPAAGFGRTRPAAALCASAAVFAVSAWQSHLFFSAMAWPVPYVVNLLAAPLLFLAFAVPITFGTLGVREAAFIGIYGAFDVPAECALLASFCGLAAFLGSCSVGAVLLHLQGRRGAGARSPRGEIGTA